jgi:hypothetical protein
LSGARLSVGSIVLAAAMAAPAAPFAAAGERGMPQFAQAPAPRNPAPPSAPSPAPRRFRFRPLNTLVDVARALETCWEANEPPLAVARPGMNVTVMLTFTRAGEIFGEPRFTYVTPEATAETKTRYQRAVVAAINDCVPLPFTPALGNALAGTPKVMPFIDRRNEKGI